MPRNQETMKPQVQLNSDGSVTIKMGFRYLANFIDGLEVLEGDPLELDEEDALLVPYMQVRNTLTKAVYPEDIK